jgi:hypothetical protein
MHGNFLSARIVRTHLLEGQKAVVLQLPAAGSKTSNDQPTFNWQRWGGEHRATPKTKAPQALLLQGDRGDQDVFRDANSNVTTASQLTKGTLWLARCT